MNATTHEKLDAEELFHLAIKASEKSDHDKAIAYLKESLALKPNANTQYILAAEHAEIGMYDGAIEEMEKALQLNPNLWTAHFQKGLLFVTLNKKDEAIESWQPLFKLADTHFLYQFAKGLTSALEDKGELALQYLNKGIELNKENLALNNDMRRVIENINNLASTEQSTTTSNKSTADAQHLYLSAYDSDAKQ